MAPVTFAALTLLGLLRAVWGKPLPFFVKSADMSFLPVEDCQGTCSQFRTAIGQPTEDALAILASYGVNTVRIRTWVNPVGDQTYANLTGTAALAKRVVAHGLKVWLDFHYSDTWADPGHQYKPAAWDLLSMPQLLATVYNYTSQVMQLLIAQGTTPLLVQIGNEIDPGMLWAATGAPCNTGGDILAPCSDNWSTFGGLVYAGIRAVRAATNDSLVLIHTSKGSKLSQPGGVDGIISYYTSIAANATDDFDGIGLSYYPHWGAGNTTDLAQLQQLLDAFPDKWVVLAETAYPYAGDATPGSQFPWTKNGQMEYLQSVLSEAQEGGASGISWWGTEYVNGSGAGMTALFDQNYVATPALQSGWS
jgi:arabinogalactan endo-1,4-beta-galactosidase